MFLLVSFRGAWLLGAPSLLNLWTPSLQRVEQYNGAKMLDVFCVKILKCEYEYEGEKTWFDYGD